MLHRSPREFGRESSLWTLEMVAEVAFEEGLTEERVSGETIRATFSRLLGVGGCGPSGGSPPQTPCTKEKKASARPTDGDRCADPDTVGGGLLWTSAGGAALRCPP